MVHYINFGIAFAFSVAGLACYLIWPSTFGFFAFIAFFLVGSWFSNKFFHRYATLDQVKEDLEARLRSD